MEMKEPIDEVEDNAPTYDELLIAFEELHDKI